MKVIRGLFFGFVVGAVVGLVIYLRMQRLQREAVENQRALRIKIPEKGRPAAQPAQKAAAKPASAPAAGPDPLTEIVGIGPVYAKRLQAAGIHTFAELAAATPAQLAEIIGPRAQPASLKGWIAAAKKLA